MAQEVAGVMGAGRVITAQEARSNMGLGFAKKGLMWAAVSAVFWGLGGVLLSLGLGMAPFSAGATIYTGALVGGAMNDGLGGIYLMESDGSRPTPTAFDFAVSLARNLNSSDYGLSMKLFNIASGADGLDNRTAVPIEMEVGTS